MKKNKKVLITGGAGFFGSHIAIRMIQHGHDVLIIDSFNSETSPRKQKNLNIDSVTHAAKEYGANLKIYKLDITSSKDLKTFFKKENPNVIIHAAALTMDRASMDIPLDFIKTNIMGTQLILNELLSVDNFEQLIFISTRSAIGLAPEANTSMNELEYFRPINPYGASKAAAESLIHSYHFDTNIPVKICRMQPMYGPRCRHDMFPFILLNSFLKGKKATKYGSGEGVRDWLFIDDAVEAIYSLFNLDVNFEIFNIGTGVPTTTNELISVCEEVIGSKIKIKNIGSIRGDAHFAGIADTSKIRLATGWEPKTLLSQGIKQTLDYMINNPYFVQEID